MNSPSTPCSARRWIEIGLLWLVAWLSTLVMAQGSGFTPLSERRPAPALVLPDMDDKAWNLAELRGRVVVVNFWATWCPPCRREFPSLERLQKHFPPKDLQVIAVNVGEDVDTIFAFTGTPAIPVLLDQDAKAMTSWRVGGLPSTYVIDRDGSIILRALGGREFDDPASLAQLGAVIAR